MQEATKSTSTPPTESPRESLVGTCVGAAKRGFAEKCLAFDLGWPGRSISMCLKCIFFNCYLPKCRRKRTLTINAA